MVGQNTFRLAKEIAKCGVVIFQLAALDKQIQIIHGCQWKTDWLHCHV
jgi:hypothetical protein